MGFMKRFFGHHHAAAATTKEEATTPVSTPATSTYATPVVSPAGSIIDVEVSSKYHNDPMRTSKRPDTYGHFLDPMGGHGSYSVGRDVTNTGA